jgi:hypothetical protein
MSSKKWGYFENFLFFFEKFFTIDFIDKGGGDTFGL